LELITVRDASGVVGVSALGMMNIWQFFNHAFAGDSLQWVFVGIVRNFPTMVIVYWIAMGLAGLLVNRKYIPQAVEPAANLAASV
jgi:ABC-type amino acid transport system permease subunit